jgi:ABC-type transport system substrate-binding protein
MKRNVFVMLLVVVAMLFTACAPATPQVITVEKEVIVEKPVIQTVVVEKEVAVEKEVVRTVEVEKIVEVEKEIVKTVEVEKIVEATPKPGGKMVWARHDPTEGNWGNYNLCLGNYSGFHSTNPAFLTAWNATGAQANQPGLAYKWEESEDHLVWTFYLRDDVRWSDGTPSTADDHLFTIDMITNPEFGSPLSSYWKDVKGYQDVQDGKADHLAGVEKIDDYTFSITFDVVKRREPVEWSQYYLMPYHKMKDQTVAEWQDMKVEDRINVGPYYVTDMEKDQYYAFKANPYFYLGEPRIDEWVYRAIPNWAVLVAGLKSGEIDVADVTPLDEVPGLREAENLQIVPDAVARGYMFWFNQQNELIPQKIRQAMQKSVDRQLIIDTLWEGYGWTYPCRAQPQGVPLEGVIPDANIYDPEAAKALIQEAIDEGWDPESEIRLQYYYTTEFTKQIMAAVADMWTDVGLNINYSIMPEDKVIEQFYETGDYEVLYGCCADPGTTEHWNQLYNYYYGGLQYPDGYNATLVNIPELDEAVVTINETFDRQEEIAAFQTACTILNEQVVDMPLWMSPGLWTMNNRLHNSVTPDGHFNEWVHEWWVEN